MMNHERDLIPYEAQPLLGERLLVLAPHPDDEALACGGVIAHHARDHRRVVVVIVTDGAAAAGDASGDADSYSKRREQESVEGLRALGVDTEPRFLRFPDRGVAAALASVKIALAEILEQEKPDLILAPSPVEIHPDHVAVSRALVELIHSDETLRGVLAITRIGFYEVSQPIQPNTLVDITAVADAKAVAISAHRSQHDVRDYQRFAQGLNEYRTMTLGSETRAAEGYWLTTADVLRTTPWSELCRAVSPQWQSTIDVPDRSVDITVIVRTKNRLTWLGEAVRSIRANGHPAKIVVVNDGGEPPDAVLRGIAEDILIIDHPQSLGRSEAMNAGVRAATTEWVAFLDDDDLYYPEHLGTLAAAASAGGNVAWYTDAVSSFHELLPDGRYAPKSKIRQYAQDFERDLLLLDNFIPLTTILVRREHFLAVGGFDPAFDLFEDWDFLIRLSQLGGFQRVPRITCEIRHFPSSGSLIVSSPVGSRAFCEAKLQVWAKHRDRLTHEAIANAFELFKQRMLDHTGRALEFEGRSRHLESDVVRLEREKTFLMSDIGAKQGEIEYERLESARALERLARSDESVRQMENLNGQYRAELSSLQEKFAETLDAAHRKNGECDSLARMLEEHKSVAAKQATTISELFSEIDRLNGILNQVYRSRTWKLHQMLERAKGKG